MEHVAAQAEPERAAPSFKDSGRPLEADLREPMERSFGFDFAGVRIHREPSDEAARTVGTDIGMPENPRTPGGVALLAHELAHVVQQSRGGGTAALAADAPAAERAAGAASRAVLNGEPVGTLGGTRKGIAWETEEERRLRRANEINAINNPWIAYGLDPGKLDREYRAALATARQTGYWQDAAEKLNGMNHEAIQSRLAELTDKEVTFMHQGALDNPRVGGGSNIAKLSAAGVPRASTIAPAPAPKPAVVNTAKPNLAQPMSDDVVRGLSGTDKLLAAYERAKIANATVKEIEQLISPQALVMALATMVGIWLLNQWNPGGWAADIGIGITALFVGMVLFDAIKHLIAFADAVNAKNEADLQLCGQHFAKAIAEIGVQTLVLIITHSMKSKAGGNPPPGATPYEAAPVKGWADMVTPQGKIIRMPVTSVPVKAITPATVISPELALELGVKGSTALMSVATGPKGTPSGGGGGGGSGPGGGKPPQQTEAERLQAKYGNRTTTSYPPEEWAHIERLENQFPKLKEAQLRPKRRPRIGAEHVFEERMETTQGNYTLTGYSEMPSAKDPSKMVSIQLIEIDGITLDGWVQEIKIEQSVGKAEQIVAELRVDAFFAREFGLRGVKYSISPPAVADEVELLVSNERLTNVFRAK
ncbi:hypothetical protein Rhe02_62820 [Rhizocola hellebori]|uniref:eCIS core domain-containing protein n=1 Tax=Rhizocola hellebori TaxID=1392758 RepID=A0A8J3VJ29_9ACTN|nr:DUF4157 domain-containing protein [Rhizocola hellebori]GIH08215.1 hypothetical protein Rhe02_62820 [Rhizocola hellebori]